MEKDIAAALSAVGFHIKKCYSKRWLNADKRVHCYICQTSTGIQEALVVVDYSTNTANIYSSSEMIGITV